MADDAVRTVVREGAVDAAESWPVVVTMPWWQMIGVRVLRTYLTTLVGLLTAGGFGVLNANGVQLPPAPLAFVQACAIASLAPALMSLLLNTIEILSGLDVRRPTLRA